MSDEAHFAIMGAIATLHIMSIIVSTFTIVRLLRKRR